MIQETSVEVSFFTREFYLEFDWIVEEVRRRPSSSLVLLSVS